MTFIRDAVRVIVPATSANLGPGFDSVGIALGVYDELIAMVSDDEGVLVEVSGEGASSVPRDEQHLVAASMLAAFDAMEERPSGFVLRCVNTIPHGRGLGSSASARVGGLLLARSLVENGEEKFSNDDILQMASQMEGHPDNVAAALFGGFTIAWTEDVARSVSLDVHPEIVPVVCIPSHELPTEHARGLLEDTVTRSDATFNLARTGLLVHAVTNDPTLLMAATADRLHQQQRRSAYPHSLELVETLRANGVPAMISGAGPSVLVLASESTASHVVAPTGWLVDRVPVDTVGAQVVPLP